MKAFPLWFFSLLSAGLLERMVLLSLNLLFSLHAGILRLCWLFFRLLRHRYNLLLPLFFPTTPALLHNLRLCQELRPWHLLLFLLCSSNYFNSFCFCVLLNFFCNCAEICL